ncbi:carboxypeptidase-like regulatory domain-containing protein [Pontibacter ruber]|uniref:Carboxypeptidase-like regulatory domain-containing protein n=1 Tax=Pontibacter ruber TaxID=1343895 RepID=A0ABW5CTJ2_9BACT|nr:carboxypeptidase-like regulatory domain-containing protein [Pontibacter ruber]
MEDDSHHTYYRRSILGKLIYTRPVYYLWRPFYDFYKSVRWLHPQGWVRSVFSLFDEDYRRSENTNQYTGFFITNKPKYQPGDTVKYKAFIVDKKGRPVKGNAILYLNKYGAKARDLGTIQPYKQGAYEGYFILHDSLKLQLDQQYNLVLSKPGKKKETYITQNFRYEDYELKENSYKLALNHKEHQSGQSNSITVRGTDANGMNLLDARVEIVVRTNRIGKSELPLVFITDTLWVHQQPLDAAGETSITIPESIFPEASIYYSVTATFLNSSNERFVDTKEARYHYTLGRISFSLLQDSVLVQYLEGNQPKPKEAVLTAYNADYDALTVSKVTLPILVPLNAYAAGYKVESGKISEDLDLTEKEALLTLQTSRSDDSLIVAIQNPRRLPYWYYVYRGEKLVARGKGNNADELTRYQATGDKPYFVNVHYMWAGEMHKLQDDAPLQKYLLSIDLQSPMVVYPGQQANLKVKVKDFAGKPVPDVDLTAYALTSKFKHQNVPGLPNWNKYKKQKPTRELAIKDDFNSGSKLMDWAYWSRRMGLDSIAYYHFLYPKKGFFTDYSGTMDSITQVSPFVVDSGRVVPVHVVYLDNVPVYFSQTDVLPAYAFAADSGYHNIKLRTADKLITLDSVYLKHKYKLVLSADITGAQNPIAKAAEKYRLSDQERSNLYRYLFYVEHKPRDYSAYLKQGNRVSLLAEKFTDHPVYHPEGALLVGPYSPNWMQYVRLNRFTTNFMMEPAYTYYFGPSLLKMRQMEVLKYIATLPLWDKRERKPELIKMEAMTERKVQESWEEAQNERLLSKLYTSNTSHRSSTGTGRIGWSLQPSPEQKIKLVLLHKTGKPDSLLIYPRESTILFNLKPATYTLTLSFESGLFASADVKVKPFGQTQVYFDSVAVKQASGQSKHLLQLIEDRIQSLKKGETATAVEQQQFLQLTQQTTYSYNTGYEQYSHEVSGVVVDKNTGESLPGVAVILKGTTTGAATDANGRYKLHVPANGVLVYRFIGYVSEEVAVNGRESIDVALEADARQLQEVVVVGYGMERRSKAVSFSVSNALAGQVAGVQIRGAASIKAEDAKPLIIVDGVPYNGSQADLKNITSTKTLKGDEATALYGSLGAAGVIIITTKNGGALGTESPENVHSIRNNFSDYAFWQPRLTTNKQGEASFNVTFPDDITSWNAYVLGMNNRKYSGSHASSIKSFKAMMATLHLPRFMVEGDKAHVVGKALNYLPDSAQVTTYFEVNGERRNARQRLLQKSFTDTLHITAPGLAPDSVEVLYTLQKEGSVADGEKRFVSIYPKGVAETTGNFLSLHADTTFSLSFDLAKGPVTMRTQGDLLEVMLDEIDYLHKYEYWCSEQAASKLKGLLLEKRIRQYLSQPFEHDHMTQKLIKHLEKSQQKNGAWAWWQEGPAYAWITNQVSEALVLAKKEGYTVKVEEQKLKDYLVYTLESELYTDKLTALETLHQLKAEVDYSRYVQELAKKRKLTLEDQLRLSRMRQSLGIPVQLDTLQKYKKQTMLGGLYWGQEKYSLFNNNITNTLLAYQILSAAGNKEKELAQIRAYLVNERRAGHWRNTYESARILETLLPDLLQPENGSRKGAISNIRFSGAVNFESKSNVTDTTFTATKPLVVKKEGKLPLFFTAYQTTWNSAPEPINKDFTITTSLKGLKGDAVLQAGTPVEMLVEVEVKADADYVMIEVPIPASCSYDSKTGKGPFEVHREYFRNKVSIFCDRLPKGKYTYSIKLLPRYTGSYTLNPAKAELMYFPTFFGRNKIKKVVVK